MSPERGQARGTPGARHLPLGSLPREGATCSRIKCESRWMETSRAASATGVRRAEYDSSVQKE